MNIKEIIEPEQKHEVRANVRIASTLNNMILGNVLVPSASEFDRANGQMIRVAAEVAPAPAPVPNDNNKEETNQQSPIYSKCLDVMNRLQIPEEAANKICVILTEALQQQQEQEQQPKQNKPPGTPSGNVTQQGPPMSGQFGAIASNCCAKKAEARKAQLDKEIAIKTAQIQQQKQEITEHKARKARLASLEKQVQELKLESYLRKHIADEPIIHWQAMKFASKNMTVEDLREVYENIPPKTVPKSRVKLRVASTAEDDDDDSIRPFRNKETNNKIMGSFFGNSNNNEDY